MVTRDFAATVYHGSEDKLIHFYTWPTDKPNDVQKISWSRDSAEKIAFALLKVVALADEDYNNRWNE